MVLSYSLDTKAEGGFLLHQYSEPLLTDRKLSTLSGVQPTDHSPELIGLHNYYPFGMYQPGHNYNASDYRYGFQGQEKDDEIKGTGNSINYKYRIHDPRLGKFLSVDPLAPSYPWNSPYAFSENKVTAHVELEGLEAFSYLLTQIFGGVGQTDISLEGDVGIVLAGVKIKGAAGIGYDSKGNFALYYQTGGFADLFGALGGPSTGGNPAETGEFTLGLGVGVEFEESYNWKLNSVLDLAGGSYSLDIEVSVYKVLGIDFGINKNSKHDVVGLNWGSVVGFGLPADVGVTGTNTSLVAFQLGDISDLRSSRGSITNQLKGLGISDYSISLTSMARNGGYSSLQWQGTYTDSAGNVQTITQDSGVSYRVLENGSVATQRVFDSLK